MVLAILLKTLKPVKHVFVFFANMKFQNVPFPFYSASCFLHVFTHCFAHVYTHMYTPPGVLGNDPFWTPFRGGPNMCLGTVARVFDPFWSLWPVLEGPKKHRF